ncbi:MAG: pyridoxamine 5'-phosphate oxidase family protein [Hyphomicrobiaceae bacterium]|nr:pyridoxamine 5'-phosphate oxidase family protein [Hyphomicrobiaceae bacterium]
MDPEKHLSDLLNEFKTGMLITRHGGRLHARPMTLAGLSTGPEIYLATNIESPKVQEIEANPEVLLTLQSNSQFASLDGTARISRDRAMIDKLWSDAWRMWFPGGKDDPQLCLLEIEPRGGEYWDNSGANGIRYAIEGMKAVFQGRTPQTDQDQHAKVDLQG